MNVQVQVIVVAVVFFALGWLLHRPSEPATVAAPQCEPVPCIIGTAASKPVTTPRKKIRLAPAASSHAPLLPSDYEQLRTCFTGEAYHGSAFTLHLGTGDHGEVTRVRLVGDEFMSTRERDCVRGQVKTWQLGDNIEPDVVVKVVL